MKLGKIPTLVNGGNYINCVGFSSNIEKVRRVLAVIWVNWYDYTLDPNGKGCHWGCCY